MNTNHPEKAPGATDYAFDGGISRPVLENYLARSITMSSLADLAQLDEDLRMLRNTGAKFVGRAAYVWSQDHDEESHFAAAAEAVKAYRDQDPDTIFQAAIFEAVAEHVTSQNQIPPWVFEEFGLPVESRTFEYEAMLYDSSCQPGEIVKWRPHAGNNWMHRYFRDGTSVPDMSKPETQMWFYYRARRYIDAGYEALHLGQVHLMNANDPGHKHWWSVLERIRRHAREHARRHFILLDAHTHGIALDDGGLLFDFHTYPLHIRDVVEKPKHGVLEAGFRHAIYGKSLGGRTPSGWSCDSLPFLVEFDNYGCSASPGIHLEEKMWVWGWDEICWFAHQPKSYRNEFLRYAWKRVRELDSNGYLQMPGARKLADPVNGQARYHANTPSPACPNGFGQEQTIKDLWAEAASL